MTAVEALKSLKNFLKLEVASSIELQKEKVNLNDPTEYVNPYVSIITLPHKNFIPLDFQVPYILVGLENGDDKTDEHTMNIRIACATYGGDLQNGTNLPDETGYIDLLNLLERIKAKLIKENIIEGNCMIEKPITYGIYDEEVTYPYWYGYLRLSAQLPIVETQLKETIRDLL